MIFRRESKLRASVEKAWPLVCDTERLNRAVGLAPVEYGEPAPASLDRSARSSAFGFIPVSWIEPPYEFVAPRYHSVRRTMRGGPFAFYRFTVRLDPDGPESQLRLEFEAAAHGILGRFLASFIVPGILERIETAVLDAVERGSRGEVFPFKSNRPSPKVDEEALRSAATQLQDSPALNRLIEHLRNAPDEDAVGMRPFELADRWGLERLSVLSSFLKASRSGLLDMSWEVLCPNCRVPKAGYSSLTSLKMEAHCETCEFSFTGDFDQNIEVRFSAQPSIRKMSNAVFCIGSPARSEHRLALIPVPAEGSAELLAPLPQGRCTLRVLQSAPKTSLIPHEEGGESVAVETGAESSLKFRPGPVMITVKNSAPQPVWAALELESWSDKGATAAFVTTLQDFRDLFSSEILAPGQSAAIKSLAFIFTDLKDSTATYSRIGDAKAYSLVRRHFDILIAAMKENGGGVVKTIGDAVMAAFVSTEGAVKAALKIQKDIGAFNASRPGETPILVKLGIHCGPAIAVTMNEALDYFGTTVNAAARIQSLSEGGEIIFSPRVLEAPGIRALLADQGGDLDSFHAGLKGISEDAVLWRFRP